MTSLLEDADFREFLLTRKGSYQPIPIAGIYNMQALRAPGCARRWEAICRVLPKDRPQKILDVGCSLGYFGMVGVDAGHSVDGFDTDEEAIYWSNKVIKEFGIPNIKLWVVSNNLLENLRKIPDDSYDYILYLSLHHHMCSTQGIEEANEILQEMSRIAPNMIFDMGQSNEVQNGWLTWLEKIPQFENHRIELPEWVLENSKFNYAACIGDSPSHEIDRLLFLFIRNLPEGVELAKKLITIRDPRGSHTVRGYNVKKYVWKNRGGGGAIHSSDTCFPVMDLRATMTTRYYIATNIEGKHFFIKEYVGCWLSPNKNYQVTAQVYERGKVLQDIKEVRDRVVSPIAMEGNVIIYPYYNWPSLWQLQEGELKHNFFDELLEVAGRIYQEIGVFDLNPNNILYNKETGEYKLIDFEPAHSNFTFRVFNARIAYLFDMFKKRFGMKS